MRKVRRLSSLPILIVYHRSVDHVEAALAVAEKKVKRLQQDLEAVSVVTE